MRSYHSRAPHAVKKYISLNILRSAIAAAGGRQVTDAADLTRVDAVGVNRENVITGHHT